MSSTRTEVLNHQAVEHKITRMAWQLCEEFYREEEIVLAGIAERGFILAEKLAAEMARISPIKVDLRKLNFNKDQVLSSTVTIEPQSPGFEGKSIAVIDDVLNSGSTLIYGVRYFLDFPVKTLKTAVLVDRNHKRYPVKADFKGLSLSTSMQEHVQVELGSAGYSVTVSEAP